MNIQFNHSQQRWPSRLLVAFLLVTSTMTLALLATVPAVAQEDEAAEPQGYMYTVLPGDSWGTVAQEAGLTVATLQAANPDDVTAADYLLEAAVLFIPLAQSQSTTEHVVKSGESWSIIAAQYDIPIRL